MGCGEGWGEGLKGFKSLIIDKNTIKKYSDNAFLVVANREEKTHSWNSLL